MSTLIDHLVRACDGLAQLVHLADLDWRVCA
jgi:hypothetical protein